MKPLCILLLALLLPASAAALEITAVAPASAHPGGIVTIHGGPFTDTVTVRLGEEDLPVIHRQARQLLFEVPSWPAGDYLLALGRDGQYHRSAFIFRIMETPPSISAIFPAEIDLCSAPTERQIRIAGEHFGLQPRVLINETAVPLAAVRPGAVISPLDTKTPWTYTCTYKI